MAKETRKNNYRNSDYRNPSRTSTQKPVRSQPSGYRHIATLGAMGMGSREYRRGYADGLLDARTSLKEMHRNRCEIIVIASLIVGGLIMFWLFTVGPYVL